MTVAEVLDGLKNGKKLKDFESVFGKSVSWIQRRLRSLGFEWDNSAKVWRYAGFGNPPYDAFLAESHSSNTPVTPESHSSNTPVTPESHSSNTPVTPESHSSNTRITLQSHRVPALTAQEILQLRDMLDVWKNKQSVGHLSDAVAELNRGSKVRRSILVQKDALDKWDAFCDKLEGFEKGDLLSLALLEFIDKYGR